MRRLAWDLSLFQMAELGFVRLLDRFTTGSSIMPNKRNPDVVEILRGSFAEVAAAHAELLHVVALPSGYHRDLQLIKRPLLRGVEGALASLRLVPALLEELVFDEARAKRALDAGMLATDRAVEKALSGMTFRDAYREVAGALQSLGAVSAEELEEAARASVRARVSPGGPGALLLDRISARLRALASLCGSKNKVPPQ